MARGEFEGDACPIRRSLDVVGDRWMLFILRDAFAGVRRFSDFQRGLGVAKNILASRLRDLIEAGVMETAPASDGSAYRDYVLTAKGHALQPALAALAQWGRVYLPLQSEAIEARDPLSKPSVAP